MKTRCNNPTREKYERYGGRGITVCERWLRFENFIADMGERPAGTTIDRIDNDGNYEPSNCRWAMPREQGLNRSNNKRFSVGDVSLTRDQWSEITGLNASTLRTRLDAGESPETALSRPAFKPQRVIVQALCMNCNALIEIDRAKLMRGRGKYCSRKCANAATVSVRIATKMATQAAQKGSR